MTEDEPDTTDPKVGDLVPTWILDDDGTLVGVAMARVIGISADGQAELDDPAEAVHDTQETEDTLPEGAS
jgi:hypothetical protein